MSNATWDDEDYKLSSISLLNSLSLKMAVVSYYVSKGHRIQVGGKTAHFPKQIKKFLAHDTKAGLCMGSRHEFDVHVLQIRFSSVHI